MGRRLQHEYPLMQRTHTFHHIQQVQARAVLGLQLHPLVQGCFALRPLAIDVERDGVTKLAEKTVSRVAVLRAASGQLQTWI